MMSPTARDTLTLIDKTTLEPVASLREPGKTLAHIEFTKDGRYALASVWEMDGALIVYDAQTLKEVKRLPMKTRGQVQRVEQDFALRHLTLNTAITRIHPQPQWSDAVVHNATAYHAW